ncbi:tannase/feruloyl esterase family alpha/beta hydrolase [Aureimonas sp. AU22]|uniref:tannase/feruloyl esterase family alpha/beta hydrolase n=1 Tax=Aureimonas sp. AU22 TaxID=1638162 RepID=UPI0007059E7C|nr:tannase/feruloyl esterase family alpha/beta hydrolase [Aureimonas sp. AU22]BAT29881.1 tannase and feruloyl esterase [Aureimonas sp. AU22]
MIIRSPLLAAGILLVSTSGGTLAAALDRQACETLSSSGIPADTISLKTGGAAISSARWTDLSGSAPFCKVLGTVLPVDPEAPAISWEIDLPSVWNGRMLQYGGGGYNGILPETTKASIHGPLDRPVPLAQGYVTFGSDSGHTAQNTNDASFAKNDEALVNYAYMHIRKTRDVAAWLVKTAYGEEPRATYFAGGSTGGREALTAALRWPDIYNGIISYYPTANFVGLRLWGAALNRAIYDDNSAGWIAPDLVKAIADYATEQCDDLDGAKDGLVSNVAACRARAQDVIDHFACQDGQSDASCLTPVQIDRTIKVYHEGYSLPYELANGFDRYPGYNSLEGITMNLGKQATYDEPVISGPNAHHAARAYEFFQHFIGRDGKFDYRSFDIANPGPYRDRLLEISEMADANNPDLSAFQQAGGKVILVQGSEDPSVTPLGTAAYYENVRETMGADKASSFVRFYMLPGLAHGKGNFAPTWDSLAALDNWVVNGIVPEGYVATDTTDTPTRGRTLPVCAYPTWPRFEGKGDVRDAANFTCASKN